MGSDTWMRGSNQSAFARAQANHSTWSAVSAELILALASTASAKARSLAARSQLFADVSSALKRSASSSRRFFKNS